MPALRKFGAEQATDRHMPVEFLAEPRFVTPNQWYFVAPSGVYEYDTERCFIRDDVVMS